MVWAEDSKLPIFTPASINEPSSIGWLEELKSDLLIVCDYGQILSSEALSKARLGGINLHGSLLPRHRGAAPVQWSILAGNSMAGVSVIHMTPKLDAGPVLEQRSIPIGPNQNAEELEMRLSQLGVEPTMVAIDRLAAQNDPDSGGLVGVPQAKELTTKAPRLKKTDGQLDLRYPILWIDRQIRGLQPWPGVFANMINDQGKSVRLVVHKAHPVEIDKSKLIAQGLTPGQVIFADTAMKLELTIEQPKQWVAVVAQDGLLVLDTVQIAGKLPMLSSGFVSGYGKQSNLRFDTPSEPHELLEKMMAMNNSSISSFR
jgi:methionyl-tRNA formyltransferase